MWIYLLKFSACLAILLLFYKWVLEKVHIHHFKRYYLLSAFIISLGIPLITFTQYITVTVEPTLFTQNIDHTNNIIETLQDSEANILPMLLWSLYSLGAILFALKFLTNLKSLIKSIRNNPRRKTGSIHHVLLQELIVPHTFFSYIFFNRKEYETYKIPQEVFWHEETHAVQKHSLDILLLELLQIVFWFHPLVYWSKHLVKLNHEFLADQAVLKKGASVPNYQNMVLAFSSSDSYRNAIAPPLTNAIYYSSTRLKLFGKTFVFGPSIFGQVKKRIVIMKTKTSKKAIWLKGLLLIPLMALLLYSFSTNEIHEIQKMETVTTEPGYQQGIMEHDPVPASPAKKTETPKTATAPLPPSQASNGENKNQRDPQKKVGQLRLILIKDYNKMYGVYEGLKQKESKTKNERNALIALFSHLEKSYADMNVEEKKLVHQPYPPSSSKTSLSKTINGDSESNQKPKLPKELSVPYRNLYMVPQPPPQPNPDPVKYIKELAEKGATFYIGPHQYKTDEAIELVRKSKDPNIDVSDYPIVKLGGC